MGISPTISISYSLIGLSPQPPATGGNCTAENARSMSIFN
jgi:hypothetical protein